MSSRNAVIALILFLSLALSGPSTAFSSDYEGLKVSPVKRATTTTNGQRISYPKTGSPEVTVVTVDIPPGSETGVNKGSEFDIDIHNCRHMLESLGNHRPHYCRLYQVVLDFLGSYHTQCIKWRLYGNRLGNRGLC